MDSKQFLKPLDKNLLKETHFVPMKRMKDVIDILENKKKLVNCEIKASGDYACSPNLFKMQKGRLNDPNYEDRRAVTTNKESMFSYACYKAIYAQDWNKLLYILKKNPKWNIPMKHSKRLYSRIELLLLMYHPESRTCGALNDYLHMVWGCRNPEDKMAVLKILLTLPRSLKMYLLSHLRYKEEKYKRNSVIKNLDDTDL